MLMAATVLAAFADLTVLAKKDTITPPTGPKITPSKQADAAAEEEPAEEPAEEPTKTKTKVTKADEYTRHLKFDADNSFRVV